MNSAKPPSPKDRVSSGIVGLDEILHGGFIDRRGYLIRGGPGTGKTTLGLHFLGEGARRGEAVLYITLGESEGDLRRNAHGVGLDTSGIEFLDLSPESAFFAGSTTYDLFSAAEVERDPITRRIVECVRRVRPRRVFLDSTSHLRYLSIDAHQFRKQLISFIRFLLEQESIVLYTSEATVNMPDDDVMYVSDGIVNLALLEHGRTVTITKFRGSGFQAGAHTLRLADDGARVYPRLVPADHGRTFEPGLLRSGLREIDDLLHGGLERGTVTVLSGPSGAGKTSLALQFARQAAAEGGSTAFFAFEESVHSICRRADNVKLPVRDMLERGGLRIHCLEPLALSADEIAHLIRREVETRGVRTVIIDGIAGYQISIRGDVQAQLRSVFKYLGNMGVTTIAINETSNITGEFRATEVGISYMADNILFLRYLELRGEMRKAIGILKKRLGDFERTLREFAITPDGIVVGEALSNLRGILSGIPTWTKELESDELLHH